MTRQEANRQIIQILSQYIEENPDIRFHQALHNLNLEEQVVTEGGQYLCKDLYNLEPQKALEKMKL